MTSFWSSLSEYTKIETQHLLWVLDWFGATSDFGIILDLKTWTRENRALLRGILLTKKSTARQL